MVGSISILVDDASGSSWRTFYDCARFADELGRYSGLQITVCGDGLHDVPADGFLLVYGDRPLPWMLAGDEAERSKLLQRVFLLQGQRAPGVLEVLEAHRLAGGIEAMRYMVWRQRPERESGYGVVGLRSVVDRMGGVCAPEPFCSQRYCVFNEVRSQSLTQALAEYLKAFTWSA